MFNRHPSSYRDPSGFLFFSQGKLYRQVNKVFQSDFDLLHSSGLYDNLIQKNLLIPHTVVNENLTGSPEWYGTLQPQMLSFISYPYEWSFEMLKDAALTTLKVLNESLEKGMILKDASAYNVQLHNGKMTFIDTLSFEKYDETKPWIAYRQFCEHFLGPLALMHYLKYPVHNLFLAYPDGIPLELIRTLLPFKSKLNIHTYLHLHVHAKASKKSKGNTGAASNFSKQKLFNIIKSLEAAIASYSFGEQTGVWSDYYDEAYQREDYVTQKKKIIESWTQKINFESAIDIGANEGEFSEIIAAKGAYNISADFDHYSINNFYKKIKTSGIKNIHPLVIDLSAPSPAIGVNNEERASFSERVNVDLVVALALIHHLCVGKNIPFEDVVKLVKNLGRKLIIEFVPKEDPKVILMLQQKKDVYNWYTKENFLDAFSKEYKIKEESEVGNSKRSLYLMESYES